MKMISQRTTSDCGVACLAMILDNFGIKSSYTKVAEHIRTDKNGSSIYGICKASEVYNIKATALSGSFEEFTQAVFEKEFHFPVIARIVNASNMSHFIIIKSVKNNKIQVFDPDINTGKRTYSFDFFSKIFLHEIITFEKTEKCLRTKAMKSSLVKYMYNIINRKSLFYMVLLMVMSGIVTAIGLASSMLIKYITDDVFRAAGGTEEHIEMLAVLITSMFVLYLTRFGIQFLRGKISLKLTSKLNKNVIQNVYKKLLSLPVSFFARKETADIMQRFSAANEIVQASMSIIMTCSLDILMVIISGIFIYSISSELFKICAVILMLYITVSLIFSKTIEKSNRETVYTDVKLNNCIKETAEGIMTIKALHGENAISEKFEAHYLALQTAVIKAGVKNITKSSILELIESVGILVIFWVASVNIANGFLSLGSLMAVYSMLGYFLTPAENIINLQSEIISAGIAAERLEEINDATSETDTKLENKISGGKIEFNNVTFRYGYNAPVISNASFTIENGTSNCITGASGIGKTTISKLIARFYEPESGSISISGRNINEYSINELRNAVCYLPQSTFLFSGTIKENLIFANNRKISDEEVNAVLSLCGAGDFVSEMGGIYALIQENASNLSGGQKQKLSLARAILRNAEILILDEITVNIDNESKKKIIETINQLENTTKIWISHDSDVINSCTSIFRLNDNSTVLTV